MADVTFVFAFLAGIVSFLSPCILPLVPAFISYLSGVTINESQKKTKGLRPAIFLNSVSFVLGFSLVFSILGVLLNTVLSSVAYGTRILLSQVGGIIIILFGISLLGLFKISWLEREHKLKPRKFLSSYPTSFVFGIAFAAGWTPCIGPILGSILTFAAIAPETAFGLLFAYSLGLGVPFLVTGLFTEKISGWINKSLRFMKPFRIITGIILILIGLLVFFNQLQFIASFFFLNFPIG